MHRFPDQPTAADVVNYTDVDTLHRILRVYGQERMSRHIARAIEDQRSSRGPITSTKQLADVVSLAFGDWCVIAVGLFMYRYMYVTCTLHVHVCSKYTTCTCI